MQVKKNACLRVGVSAFLVFLAIHYWSAAARLLQLLLGACVPLILGAAIAYVINVLMEFYERHYFPQAASGPAAKSRRPVCMLGAVLTVVLWALFTQVLKCVLP